jgi:hypothetical protein
MREQSILLRVITAQGREGEERVGVTSTRDPLIVETAIASPWAEPLHFSPVIITSTGISCSGSCRTGDPSRKGGSGCELAEHPE